MAGAKKSRVRISKNKKKSWGKFSDIKDVEEYLEEKRSDERIGGSFFDKADSELFCIESNVETKPEKVSKKLKKELRCFQNIGSFSKVPPPKSSLPSYTKRINNVQYRADERKRKRTLQNSLKEKKPEVSKVIQNGDMYEAELKDLWDEKEKEIDPEIADLVFFRDEYTRKRTPKVPDHRYQKPSLLPSIEIPHSGASYNPAFDEHQNLLRKALDVEEKKQKEEFHLKRVLTDMFPTKSEAPTEESILQEMSQGLFEVEGAEEDKVQESSFYAWNPPVSAEDRIPRARKRRKKERKEKERLLKLEKLQRKRLHEVFRIKGIKSEIKHEEKVSHENEMRRQQRRANKMFNPKTLSKHKYEAPDLEVHLTDELCDSLRTLKAEGNLLEDRYKSLQRRNLIEPRIRQKRKRKYKLKVQVKRSHRDFK